VRVLAHFQPAQVEHGLPKHVLVAAVAFDQLFVPCSTLSVLE
jgi:hypothetical protein